MPLGPMNKGDTAPRGKFQFKQNATVFPLNASVDKIVMHLWHAPSYTHKHGAGSIIFTDAASGRFDYLWDVNDTDTPGIWEVWAELFTIDGPQCSTNKETLEITDREKGYESRHAVGRVNIEE